MRELIFAFLFFTFWFWFRFALCLWFCFGGVARYCVTHVAIIIVFASFWILFFFCLFLTGAYNVLENWLSVYWRNRISCEKHFFLQAKQQQTQWLVYLYPLFPTVRNILLHETENKGLLYKSFLFLEQIAPLRSLAYFLVLIQ